MLIKQSNILIANVFTSGHGRNECIDRCRVDRCCSNRHNTIYGLGPVVKIDTYFGQALPFVIDCKGNNFLLLESL
jgi:hypothetical protein